MKIRLFLALILALSAGASPALGQAGRENPTGSLIGRAKPADIPDSSILSDEDRGRVTARQFADCMVEDRFSRISNYFGLKADLETTDKALNNRVTADCLRDGTLKLPPILYRGAQFRAAYIRDRGKVPPVLTPTPTDYATLVFDLKTDRARYFVTVMDFAQCLVRNDLTNAAKYIEAVPGSSSEKEAYAALRSQMGDCMAAGSKIALNKSMIEAFLAEAIYREVVAGATLQTKPEAAN